VLADRLRRPIAEVLSMSLAERNGWLGFLLRESDESMNEVAGL
jgi:hypothetical protein